MARRRARVDVAGVDTVRDVLRARWEGLAGDSTASNRDYWRALVGRVDEGLPVTFYGWQVDSRRHGLALNGVYTVDGQGSVSEAAVDLG